MNTAVLRINIRTRTRDALARTRESARYWWNWILAKEEAAFAGALAFILGVAIGVIVMDVRSDWLHFTSLASLQAQCQEAVGPQGVVTYHDGMFGCWGAK